MKIETEYNDEGGLAPSATQVIYEIIEASGSVANPGATSAIGKETASQLNRKVNHRSVRNFEVSGQHENSTKVFLLRDRV